MAKVDGCSCGRLSIGEGRNWHPDCPEHGKESEWWNSPEQQRLRAAASDRLRLLQVQAKNARRVGGT